MPHLSVFYQILRQKRLSYSPKFSGNERFLDISAASRPTRNRALHLAYTTHTRNSSSRNSIYLSIPNALIRRVRPRTTCSEVLNNLDVTVIVATRYGFQREQSLRAVSAEAEPPHKPISRLSECRPAEMQTAGLYGSEEIGRVLGNVDRPDCPTSRRTRAGQTAAPSLVLDPPDSRCDTARDLVRPVVHAMGA